MFKRLPAHLKKLIQRKELISFLCARWCACHCNMCAFGARLKTNFSYRMHASFVSFAVFHSLHIRKMFARMISSAFSHILRHLRFANFFVEQNKKWEDEKSQSAKWSRKFMYKFFFFFDFSWRKVFCRHTSSSSPTYAHAWTRPKAGRRLQFILYAPGASFALRNAWFDCRQSTFY